ncbi:hypothetical protein TREMEDRAFT_27243 [Tremella mesenterica DSM 1558]|uniref:uncharacterized protein n=1 Tax=Tremella mesenterica (strain ATCC 24925 / CBS 8224 / DSM 1558 / NBRC 9311 / NRRL Y-6157 / RJB 2259-6 / UBC 559-6) TaxID=578456 RepID=UPI0003F49CC5|nr:uncharacterized protein TREMEDRAFT_27243 [Tremella mesenterica DSM 1558]EIW71554.1 hypothetical protein TREMEDRAFT_27243 [Tremella mesenterica DSM 1558]
MSTRRSTHEIGKAFELHALRFCNRHLGMSLRAVGGAGDGGVDLRGWWYLPSFNISPALVKLAQNEEISSHLTHPEKVTSAFEPTSSDRMRRLRVVAQCKAERKVVGPRAVRELEGVMAHLRAGYDNTENELKTNTMAILLSQSGFTPAAMQHAIRSGAPMMLVHLPGGQPISLTPHLTTSDDREIKLSNSSPSPAGTKGAWWNPALGGKGGLLGGKMELRREILTTSGVNTLTGEAKIRTRLGVYHLGNRLNLFNPYT